MKNNNLENRIKEGFEQKNSQLNKFDLWQEIEKELPEEKKDRRFFFWFFFAGLLIGASVIWFYLPNDTKKEDLASTTTIENTLDSEKSASAAIAQVIEAETTEDAAVVSYTENQKGKDTKVMDFNENSELESKRATKANILTTKNNAYFSKKKDLESQPEQSVNQIVQSVSPFTPINNGETKSSSINVPMTPLQALPRKAFSIDLFPQDTFEFALAEFFNSTETIISPLPAKPKWLIAARGNYLKLNRKLSGANQELIDQKSNNETILYGASSDLMVSYQLLPRLRIGAGLNYTRIEEKIEWSVQGATIQDVQSDSAFFFEYFEQAYYVPGTQQQTTTVTRSLRNYNTIEQWSVPVELAFSPIQGKRFSLEILGGFQYNLNAKLNGKFIGDGNTILEGAGIYSSYKRNKVHAWYSGIGLAFRPSKNWSIITTLRYQSSQNFLQTSTNASLKYEGYSVGLGLQRSF